MPTPPPRIVTAAGSPINHMRVRGKLIVTSSQVLARASNLSTGGIADRLHGA
jgi:hypothetical protein